MNDNLLVSDRDDKTTIFHKKNNRSNKFSILKNKKIQNLLMISRQNYIIITNMLELL